MTEEYVTLLDPTKIPPRKWTIRNFLSCGEVAWLGGVGTSLFACNVAAAVAAGKAFAWFEAPEKPRTAIILSSENDLNEIRRRVAAYCAGAGINFEDLRDRLLIYPSHSICLAVKHGPDVTETALATAVRERVREEDAGLLIIDPLIKMGKGFDEKSRGDMDDLLSVVRDLVDDTECAALVVDHDVRDTVNASRCIATLSDMPEQAGYRVFRTEKLNYGRPTGVHSFRLTEHPVGNGEKRFAYVDYEAVDG